MFKILLATDGSESSLNAASFVADLFGKNGGLITVIHVFSMPTIPAATTYAPAAGSIDWDQVVAEMERASRDVLTKTAAVLADRGITAQTVLLRGRPADEICKYAENGDYDLIVVASRGQSTLKQVLLGSVSEGVSHNCKKAVLIVK